VLTIAERNPSPGSQVSHPLPKAQEREPLTPLLSALSRGESMSHISGWTRRVGGSADAKISPEGAT